MIMNAHTITPFQRKLGYDPVRDFTPIALVASAPVAVVTTSRSPCCASTR